METGLWNGRVLLIRRSKLDQNIMNNAKVVQALIKSAKYPEEALDELLINYKDQWNTLIATWENLTEDEKQSITKELEANETFWESKIEELDDESFSVDWVSADASERQAVSSFSLYALVTNINETWKRSGKILAIGKGISQEDRDAVLMWYATSKLEPRNTER